MIRFPLSPALSDCDSLASDELDALLEAQGELSHWPTPPLSEDEMRNTAATLSSAVDELDYNNIATVFRNETSLEDDKRPADVELIEKILFRAQLPPEVLALAFNILTGLSCHSLARGTLFPAPGDLLVTSVLSLAVLYTIDHPPSFGYWARSVCGSRWTALQIDKTVLQILAALDWRLHAFSSPSAIQQAMARLFTPATADSWRDTPPSEEDWNFLGQPEKPHSEKPAQLKLTVEDRSVCWLNGQITPGGTPTKSGFECAWNTIPGL